MSLTADLPHVGSEPTPKRWECRECEYQFDGEKAPATCPLCGEAGDPFIEKRSVEMDALDRRLCNLLQNGVPLAERPWQTYADELSLTEDEVIARVRRLKADVVRQISAIFDSRSLGYKSTLVAMQFPPDDVDRSAAVISRHPGVSHNYRRNHLFNLWFTLTIHSSQDLATEVGKLGEAAGALQTILLPTIRLFKIGVKLDVTGEKDVTRQEEGGIVSGIRTAQEITPREIEILIALRDGLSNKAIARRLEISQHTVKFHAESMFH